MEILTENILSKIGEQCSPHWQLALFMDHIIVSLPTSEIDFKPAYNSAKQEIIKCVQHHFPERSAEILVEVRNGSWNCSFKIGKNVI
jgi:hypothetical protein